MAGHESELVAFMDDLTARNPGESEFHQAVHEVVETIIPFLDTKPIYRDLKILERMCEPDRTVMFRVCWQADDGTVHVNRGYRVQVNNAIGPYKGGCRFHPTVTLSVLKFLGFEQQFKNSLTGLPMGGAKGGSDFDPKGKSNAEIMRFCQAFMSELFRHIGPDVDVPAGDIGVGAKEIGYMFGQYKRLTNKFEGVLTGKGLEYGGSLIRTEATGYGAVYFMENMLATKGMDFDGKTVVISGSGNVATHAAEKAHQLGGRVVTLSDSGGFIHDPDGMTQEKIDWVKDLKKNRGRISEYADHFKGATFHEKVRPWNVPCDYALPCATQNEISGDEAKALVANGVKAVSEGANMPTVDAGVKAFQEAGVLFGPAKAANAGGVAVSGMEMSQNSARMSWTDKELRNLLKTTMENIHSTCQQFGEGKGKDGGTDYVAGANIGGFVKVADAMLAFGVM
ncbi:MAG: NADP-specific glutamate dehydrogenase [Alphaproteobacteria bacterium]